MSSAVRSRDSAPEPEEDWFGEGSSFDSGEELASALFALAGTVDPSAGAPLPAAEPAEPAPQRDDGEFDWFDPVGAPPPAGVRVVPLLPQPSPAPQTWGVRTSASALPPRRPGEAGWSIRNSVQVLHRTDDVMRGLREQAVQAAFSSAAVAFQHARAASRGQRPPRRAA